MEIKMPKLDADVSAPAPLVSAPPPPAPALIALTTTAALRLTVEQWLGRKRPEAWKHAAAGAMNRWPIGAELTEEEYDAAIQGAEHIRIA